MNVIGRSPLLMLFAFLLSLEAVSSSGGDQENVRFQAREHVDFGDMDPSTAYIDIKHEQDEKEGSLCYLEWVYTDYENLRHSRLELWIHLDTEEKAFTHIKADSTEALYERYLRINENTFEAQSTFGSDFSPQRQQRRAVRESRTVTARGCSHGLANRKYKKIAVGPRGADDRLQAEEKLLEGGPFSPLGHLQEGDIDRLMKTIDWDWDSDTYKCEKIYHFLAFNAPEGYGKKNLDWLFDAVNEKTDQAEKTIVIANSLIGEKKLSNSRVGAVGVEETSEVQGEASSAKKPSKGQVTAVGAKKPSKGLLHSIGKSFRKLTKRGQKK